MSEMSIEEAIAILKNGANAKTYEDQVRARNIAIEALKEKQERDNTKQWLDDMDNPLEPLKVESALQSEVMTMNYRKEHKPDSISVLDYTIIAVLAKELGIK